MLNLQPLFRVASLGEESSQDLEDTTQIMNDMAEFLKSPDSNNTHVEAYDFSEIRRFVVERFRTFDPRSTDTRPYDCEVRQLEELQKASQQAMKHFVEAKKISNYQKQISRLL